MFTLDMIADLVRWMRTHPIHYGMPENIVPHEGGITAFYTEKEPLVFRNTEHLLGRLFASNSTSRELNYHLSEYRANQAYMLMDAYGTLVDAHFPWHCCEDHPSSYGDWWKDTPQEHLPGTRIERWERLIGGDRYSTYIYMVVGAVSDDKDYKKRNRWCNILRNILNELAKIQARDLPTYIDWTTDGKPEMGLSSLSENPKIFRNVEQLFGYIAMSHHHDGDVVGIYKKHGLTSVNALWDRFHTTWLDFHVGGVCQGHKAYGPWYRNMGDSIRYFLQFV